MAANLAASGLLYSCFDCKEKELAKSRFCPEEGQKAPVPLFDIDGENYFSCPVMDVTPESFEGLADYIFFSNGFLPGAGGYLDQSYKTIQTIRLVQSVFLEHQDKD
jgi:hypothetical protein